MLKYLQHILLFLLSTIFITELFFRIALPASEWPRGVILASGVRRFDSESFTKGYFTYGRYCEGRFLWSINPQGWNSVFEYRDAVNRDKPMIAILGDSYIEGFYSNVDQHVDVFLTDMFADSVSFYSFAMSGSILSQYIAFMKYEISQYGPDACIVFVNSSDVLSSFVELGEKLPYFFQYQRDSSGEFVEVTPVAESRSKYKDALLSSALIRYLRTNVQISLWGGGLVDENANLSASSDSFADEGVPEELLVAADFILQELNSFGLLVLIVADCPKGWIYEGVEEEAYDDVIALRELVSEYENVSMLELADFYPAEYAREGQRFSLSDNPHWNSYANEFVARTLAPVVAEMLRGEGGAR